MSDFYSGNNSLPMTPFFFDAMYGTETEPLNTLQDLQNKATSDNIWIGRYIHIGKYAPEEIQQTVWQKQIKYNQDGTSSLIYVEIADLGHTEEWTKLKADVEEIKEDYAEIKNDYETNVQDLVQSAVSAEKNVQEFLNQEYLQNTGISFSSGSVVTHNCKLGDDVSQTTIGKIEELGTSNLYGLKLNKDREWIKLILEGQAKTWMNEKDGIKLVVHYYIPSENFKENSRLMFAIGSNDSIPEAWYGIRAGYWNQPSGYGWGTYAASNLIKDQIGKVEFALDPWAAQQIYSSNFLGIRTYFYADMDGQDLNANDLIYLVSYHFEPIVNATYLYNTAVEAETSIQGFLNQEFLKNTGISFASGELVERNCFMNSNTSAVTLNKIEELPLKGLYGLKLNTRGESLTFIADNMAYKSWMNETDGIKFVGYYYIPSENFNSGSHMLFDFIGDNLNARYSVIAGYDESFTTFGLITDQIGKFEFVLEPEVAKQIYQNGYLVIENQFFKDPNDNNALIYIISYYLEAVSNDVALNDAINGANAATSNANAAAISAEEKITSFNNIIETYGSIGIMTWKDLDS